MTADAPTNAETAAMTADRTATTAEPAAEATANVAGGRRITSSAPHMINLIAWVYIYLVALLGLWVVIVTASTGWSPVVVTSGSMAPTLKVGDVLLVDEHREDLVGQRTVITFESPSGDGELITHRVFEVLQNQRAYVTKGDANPTPDTDLVDQDQVRGVGRLVVPLVGLPVVWAQDGNVPALASMVVLSIAALAVAFKNSRRRVTSAADRRGSSQLADRAVRRVRYLVALMIASQFFLDAGRFEIEALGLSRSQLLITAIGSLLLINALSVHAESIVDDRRASRLALVELGADTGLVILLTTATGGSGIGWVLIALPIVEAAVRFRLAGALLHWMVMAAVTIATRLWVLEHGDAPIGEVISSLEQTLDQLGVLLLVAIPGAYLAEQLVNDVVTQRAATDAALERGRRLEHVAEIGHEVNRLGAELFETLVDSALSLGFDVADIALRVPSGEWRCIASAGAAPLGDLPEPGEPGSGLQEDDLALPAVMVDRDDHDLAEFVPLAGIGLAMLARITLSTDDDTYIALRAGWRQGGEEEPGSIEALRLLCGQATVALQNKQLVSELRELHDELEHQATHDALTGLPNRARFVSELQRALAGASDPNRRHIVLFLDLNGFKGVNDTKGHEAGDELLKLVGGRLVEAVGSAGLVARLGGDEFTVLLHPVANPKEGVAAASAIHRSLSEPFEVAGDTVVIGASIGLAYPEIGVNESELLRRADAAMYAAKANGGSTRIATYHREMDEGERRRGRLAAEFKKALEREELELAYQPVVVADTGEIAGAEALLRWTHREMGVVNTATILELAETSDRVMELNAWILRTAMGAVARLAIDDSTRFAMAVNVSTAELADPALLGNIDDALLLAGIEPDRLVVELSERMVAGGGTALDNIDGIVALGAHLSLDDFGQGKTSLGHLRGLPISQLKMDRLLVQQATTLDTDRIIFQSVVDLAHDLGYHVVAEGIETSAHQDMATEAGADLLQGYGLYRPMPLEHLQTLLQRSGKTATVLRTADAEPTTGGR